MMGSGWALALVFRESPAVATEAGHQTHNPATDATLEGGRDLFGLEGDDKGEFEVTPTIQGSGEGDSTI